MSEIDQLLYRGESESLDFKRDQYRFINASDHEKSELLKDILAMTNAWRDGPAFILLGVDAPAGGPVNIVGITSSLDDAMIQQFVNAKTNQPITFSYRETQFSGCLIGVLEIPVQDRPAYLKNEFGSLKAEKVYIRRGSSTAIALPEEIARMGGQKHLGGTSFIVNFSDIDKRFLIGSSIKIDCTVLNVAEDGKIPNYVPRYDSLLTPISERPNKNYYRELIHFAKQALLLKGIGVTVTNSGDLGAHAVRAEFVLNDPDRIWEFCMEEDFSEEPPSTTSFFSMKAMRGINAHRIPVCDISYTNGSWHISFDFRDLQPKRTLQPGILFYAGCRRSEILKLEGRIFADELPNGGKCELSIDATVKTVATDLDTLLDKLT